MNPLWIPQLCGGASASFSPPDLFVGYTGDIWDPSVTAKLWTDAGITQVASDGDVIGRCTGDVNANVLNQTTAGSKPTWQTNELNGQPVFRFDGTDDFLVHASAVINQALQCTVFAVAKQTAVDDEVIAATYASGGDIYKFHDNAGSQEFRGFAPLKDLAAAGANTWGIYTCLNSAIIGADSTMKVYLNGGAGGASASGARVAQDAALYVGALAGTSQFLAGDLAYLLIRNGLLTVAEHNSLGGWAATRFGLTWNTAT